MRVTRRGVFETNSSSTHSITLAGGDFDPTPLLVEGGICQIHPGEFGWEPNEFTDPQAKAAYAMTWAKQGSSRLEQEAMLRQVVEAETGAAVEFVKTSCEYHPWGYIDHQSDDVCPAAFVSPEALRDFIFNPASVLRTDNDNR